jgi:hypothetical protein
MTWPRTMFSRLRAMFMKSRSEEQLNSESLRDQSSRSVNFVRGSTAVSVAQGKQANLVLLEANPLDDIRNTQKIRAVVVRGRYLDRAVLDTLLARAKADRE